MTPGALWTEMHDAGRLVRMRAAPPSVLPEALAWLPVAGAALGVVAAGVAVAAGQASSVLGAVAGLGVLRGVGAVATTRLWLGLLVLEAVALASAPVATQALALVLAPVLGAWSRVVQCHGGRLPPRSGPDPLVGRATFREFGWASVVAIGGALAVFEALGLVAVLAAVMPTLLFRAVLHRRQGGMPAWGPATSGRVAEAVVIVVLAMLSPAGGR